MKPKRVFVYAISVLFLLVLTACTITFVADTSRATYFGGDVSASYSRHDPDERNRRWLTNIDQMEIVFTQTGVYHVSFSGTPGLDNGTSGTYMPGDFDINVKKTNKTYRIQQYLMPKYLRMTITRKSDNFSETHDFQ